MAKAKLKELAKVALPDFVPPMLATLTKSAFDSKDWLYEIKWDGYRTLAYIDGTSVNLYSRNNQVFNELFKPIQKALMFCGFQVILDGEIVVLNDNGQPDFNMIQAYSKTSKGTLVFYIFDILFFNGHSTVDLPLINRKQILEAIPLPKVDELQICKYTIGNGKDFFAASTKMNLEGIIAKNMNSLYSSGRSNAWLKVKNTNDCELIIIGYTKSPKKQFFASLLLGFYQKGVIIFCGHSGTGFSHEREKELHGKFQKQLSEAPTASGVPRTYLQTIVWLKPKFVCRVQYAEVTADNKLRHCSFKGLIEKNAKEITAFC